MLENILNKCREVKNDRNLYSVFDHMIGETQELMDEIKISYDGGEAGEDGVVGECVDVILCAFDIIASHNKGLTEEELQVIFDKKYEKWKNLYSE